LSRNIEDGDARTGMQLTELPMQHKLALANDLLNAAQ
jgi:hypothetical protein